MMQFVGARAAGKAAAWVMTLAAAAVLILSVRAAQATVFPAIGGQGDRAELYTCPDGKLLVGFYGRSGAWIDQLGLICSEVLPGYAIAPGERLPSKGGMGGGPIESYCEPDGAIREITFASRNENAKRKVVAWVYFACQKPKDGSSAGRHMFTNDGDAGLAFDGSDYPKQHCPGNEYATGVSIRYGAHVNAIGLICSAVVQRPPAASTVEARPASLPGIEPNTDRPGSDYDVFNPDSPEGCQRECVYQRDRCKAWTYVRPGVQGARAKCYLKNAVPAPVPNTCCASGALPGKTRGTALEEDGGIAR